MVAKRDSIAKVGKSLARVVISGGINTTEAVELAVKLERLCDGVGRYEKRYETHEERIAHRHLNLYRNKLAKAKTDAERLRWRGKIIEQEAKIAALGGVPDQDLDLDGL